MMTRMNITLPVEIARKLATKQNKSRFIAEALQEKLERERHNRLEALLLEGYRATAKEEAQLNNDWEKSGMEGWE
ncbi:MAG: hypothetical protein PHO30_04570 [Candidatus Omnitrophica bacterium]|nr:hypothetical protein [Candidatus Omnitrophota bacterium]